MEPEVAYNLLRQAIPKRPELRFRQWPSEEVFKHSDLDLHTYMGFCYIATQVFCKLVPDAVPYCFGRTHFWAKVGDTIYDPTFDQFSNPFEYKLGSKTKFKQFSKRADALLKECLRVETTIGW